MRNVRGERTLEMLPGLANPLGGAGLGLALFILIRFVTGSVILVALLPAGGPIKVLGLLVFFTAPAPPAVPVAPIMPCLLAGPPTGGTLCLFVAALTAAVFLSSPSSLSISISTPACSRTLSIILGRINIPLPISHSK